MSADSRFAVEVEMIPKTSFYNNLRKVTTKETWDMLRKKTYQEYDYTCGKCGRTGVRLDCHEIWEFNDKDHTQTLTGMVAVCEMCHHIIHHGYAEILIREGKLDRKKLINHFLSVNECDIEEYRQHLMEARLTWLERSSKEWWIELGKYAQYIK